MMRFAARWPLSIIVVGMVLAAHAVAAFGQSDEAWNGDEHEGTRARVVVPQEQRQRNTGGSDGAGLCVIASMTTNGRYQGVPGIDRLWDAAKRLPGGYYPEKFARLADGVLPGEKYASYTGTDPEVARRWNEAGHPVGVTVNTGKLYGYAPIHHMVSLVHHDGAKVALVDNNKPDVTMWMSADTFARRFVDGSSGWAMAWERLPAPGRASAPLAVAALLCAAAARRHLENPR